MTKHVIPGLGVHRLDAVNYKHLKAFVVEKAQTYAKDTLRLMLAAARAMFAEAKREEIVETNPVCDLSRFYRKAQVRKERVDPFTLDELHMVEEVARVSYPRYYAFILTTARTGLRLGEAIALKWCDIDFEMRDIFVQRNIPQHRGEGATKTQAGMFRHVEMSGQLKEVRLRHQAELKETALAAGSNDIPDWVFPNEVGAPIQANNFRRRIWSKLLAKAKVRRRTPHAQAHVCSLAHREEGEPRMSQGVTRPLVDKDHGRPVQAVDSSPESRRSRPFR